MADKSKIQWTDATWNPITGCSVVSPGCTNCYAMKLAGTRMRHHWSRKGLTDDSKAGPVWNGEVRLNEEWLDQPLRWRKPRMVFVCAHGDLFHENVPGEWVDKVFAVMALAPQHIFQVLTKRPERMRDYLTRDPMGFADRVNGEAGMMMDWDKMPQRDMEPLPNVWLGVSVEDQQRADERIPHSLATPAAKRFVSYEPALGPVDYTPWVGRLDQIIVGGESGPNARPFNIAWARWTIKQCRAAGVPVFVKQLGARPYQAPTDLHQVRTIYPIFCAKGDDMAEWPEDLRVREMPARTPRKPAPTSESEASR